MADQQLEGGIHMPPLVFFLIGPVGFGGTFSAMQWIMSSRGLLPTYIPKSIPDVTMKCLAFGCVPLLLQILVSIAVRLLFQSPSDSKIIQVHRNTANNTMEQTLLFALNLLAFSTNRLVTPERLILLTLFFVASRFIFWLGYYLFYCTNAKAWRGPGMVMSLGLNIFLFYYNWKGVYDE